MPFGDAGSVGVHLGFVARATDAQLGAPSAVSSAAGAAEPARGLL
jgi:hypothetical protein